MGNHFLAERRQTRLPVLSLEYGFAEPLFERLQAAGYGGLTDAKLMRGGRQAAGFGYGEADEIIGPIFHSNMYIYDHEFVNSIRRT